MSTFITHKVLFRKNGENITTPADPCRAFDEEKDSKLLKEQGTFCVSFDNDMLVKGHVWEVNEVTLPSWLSVAEWCRNCVAWKWAWAAGVDPSWTESWQRSLAHFSVVETVALCKLLTTKKFRSEFRASLRDQLVAWLDTAPEARRYDRPLSGRQMDAVCDRYVCLEARRLDANLYSCRVYRGVPRAA